MVGVKPGLGTRDSGLGQKAIAVEEVSSALKASRPSPDVPMSRVPAVQSPVPIGLPNGKNACLHACTNAGANIGSGVGAGDGANNVYITGVTRRASRVLDTSPPMITHASGE